MAKRKTIVDYLEYPLELNNTGLSLKDIQEETGLPLWVIQELDMYGYIYPVTEHTKVILKSFMYSMNNHKFIKSSIGQLSHRDKTRLFRNKKDTKLVLWINSRVKTLKDNNCVVKNNDIYNEVCTYFPTIINQGFTGKTSIYRYINNAKRKYLRDRAKK